MIAISDPVNATAILNATHWREAVDSLLVLWMGEGRPFSSGEVGATLREHRPDLVFSVLKVGEYIRDLFFGGTLPSYPPDPNDPTAAPVKPMQASRVTEGLYRTPAGTMVFVYAKDLNDALNHPFEVFVPPPGETQANAPMPNVSQTSLANQDSTGQTPTATDMLATQLAGTVFKGVVHADKRLNIPRHVLEAAAALSNHPLRCGDPVFVLQDSNTLMIHLKDPQDPQAHTYNIWQGTNRISIPSPSTVPFVPGTTYIFEVSADKISLDRTLGVV